MIATSNTMYEAGIRKAAILVSSLDQAAADRLLDQLGPERAALVRQAVMALDQFDADEQRRVIDEFSRIGPMVPGKCPPGIELDYLPVPPPGQTFSSDSDDSEMPASPDETLPFSFLRETEEEKLVQLLGGERPQTIALVLSHVPSQRAGEVLARFAPLLQVEVVRRLVDLENADPETLREVEQALEARLLRLFAVERKRAAGPEAVAKILASSDSRVVGNILENLTMFDQPLAERLGWRPIEFDDLVQFDDGVLLSIFRAAEPEVIQAALLGAPPEFVERLLHHMTPQEAKRMHDKLTYPGPIRLSDVDEARRRIAALAQRMTYRNSSRPAFAA